MTETLPQESPSSGRRTPRLFMLALVALLSINLALVALAVQVPRASVPRPLLSGMSNATLPPEDDLDGQATDQPVASSAPSAPADQIAPQPPQALSASESGEGKSQSPELAVVAEPIRNQTPTSEQAAEPQPMRPETFTAALAAPAPNPAAPIAAQEQAGASAKLMLINPPNSGGPIHYAIDNSVFSLLPGEYQALGVDAQRLVRFHRGDDFGDAEYTLPGGVLLFAVGETGWELRNADDNLASRLLSICRPLK